MKKVQKLLISAVCLAIGVGGGALLACGGEEKKDDGKITITYYDATGTQDVKQMKVLKTERVDKGSVAQEYTPVKDAAGYTFVDWFGTASKSHAFDFSVKLNRDTAIYAGFSKDQADARTFYVLGNGESQLLFESKWGAVISEAHKLTKTQDKNEYKITMDVKSGDEFQFAINKSWHNKRGAGYLVKYADDGGDAFQSQGSVYSESQKDNNIKCTRSGNYTFTLTTYPGDDYYNTSGTGYSEADKEVYNRGVYDKIDWVRNGDVLVDSVILTDVYIKGANITSWQNMRNGDTKMSSTADGYSMTVYLKQGEQFMFASQITKVENGVTTKTDGTFTIKAQQLDEASCSYVDGYNATTNNNMTAKAAGQYTFSYNKTTQKLSVTFDGTKAPEAMDYYIDGNAVADKWNEFVNTPANYKLAETASGSGIYSKTITLREGKELQLRACKAGLKPTTSNTNANLYQFEHLYNETSAFERCAANNANIKVVTGGEYVVTFDSYSKIITIETTAADKYDIYIKGSNIGTQQGWKHNFDAQYRMTISADNAQYEYTLIVEADKAVEFGLARYAKGASAVAGANVNGGIFIGKSDIGNSGDKNSEFNGATNNNLKCITAGTYKIVYTIATGKVDFYAVAAQTPAE